MRELSLREIQREELNMLLVVDKICKEHGLRFVLIGGTLLGAVRHGGFIPWDDDVDVAMPRPDYEKFLQLLTEQRDLLPERYALLSDRSEETRYPFLKLIDKKVSVCSPKGDPTKNLWIDILSIDGYPSDPATLHAYCKKLRFARTMLLYCYEPMRGKPLKNRLFGYYAKLRGSKHAFRKLVKLGTKYPYESAEKVGCVLWGLYGDGESYKKENLENPVSVSFEGHTFPCMRDADGYLTGIYGDYMQLPPEEKRITHGLKAYQEEEK